MLTEQQREGGTGSEAIELPQREPLPPVPPSDVASAEVAADVASAEVAADVASAEVPELKYYLYVSNTKVEMLEPQIPGTRSATDHFSRLRSVVNFLHDTGRVGTVADPKEYFAGRLSVRWGPYADSYFDKDAALVYFGGTTEDTILGLGGSAHHVIGSQGPAAPHSHSAMGQMIAYLRSQLGSPNESRIDRRSPPDDRATEAREVLMAVHLATTGMTGPAQTVEFVARRLMQGESPYPHRDSRSGMVVLLGTPLYVALAE